MGRVAVVLAAVVAAGCASPPECVEEPTALDWDEPSALGFSGAEVLDLVDGLVIGVAWPDGTLSEWALTAVATTTLGVEDRVTEVLRSDRTRCPDSSLLVPADATFGGPDRQVGGQTLFEAIELALAGVELHWSRSSLPVLEAPAALDQALRATDDGCPDTGGQASIHFGDSSLAGVTLTYVLEAPGCFGSLEGRFKVLRP